MVSLATAAPTDARTAAGRARESGVSRLERLSFTLVFGFAAAAAIILLIAPTVIVLITSFTSAYSLKFPPPGYSPRWYVALWNDSPEIVAAGERSLEVAATATAVSTLLGVAAALALARRRAAWARALDSLFMSPLMLPTLALGLALLVLFNMTGAGLSVTTLVLGHIAITTPYVLRTTSATLVQMDPALLDSAWTLGARPWFAFRTVTLPLIAPGIAAGAFIGFMASFDNVSVSLFLSDARSEMLPIRMWNIIDANLDVRAAAVSGVLIAAAIVLMLVLERLTGVSRHMR
jgi:putative spermidine/putrescine transport system permease protein